jgi:apolipoprotein N-acyltransferase
MSSLILPSFISAVLLSAPFLSPYFFPVAWVAFVPLCRAVDRQESLRRAGIVGWLVGFLANLFGFHWLVYTISVFGGFAYPLSVVVFILYAALQGAQTALFALLLKRLGYGPLFLFPVVFWVAIEFWFPFLFPGICQQPELASVSSNCRSRGRLRRKFLVMVQCHPGASAVQKRAPLCRGCPR